MLDNILCKERFSKSGFIIRDLNSMYHCRPLPSTFKITQPTIVDLGGNGTTTRKAANGRSTRTERLVGLKGKAEGVSATYDDFNVISCYYGKDRERDETGSLTRDEASEFVDRIFLPLCINNDGSQKSMTECCQNFSKLIFRTHCYGNEALGYILGDLQLKLIAHGFSPTKINRIYSHAFHLSYAPYKKDKYLPCVVVNSLKDSFLLNKKAGFAKNFYPFMKDVDGVDIRTLVKTYYDHLSLDTAMPNQKELLITSSQLLNSPEFIGEDVDEHAGRHLDLDDSWNASEIAKDSKNCECVSRLSGYALAYAGARAYQIHNGERPYPIDMEKLESELCDVMSSYSEEDLSML